MSSISLADSRARSLYRLPFTLLICTCYGLYHIHPPCTGSICSNTRRGHPLDQRVNLYRLLPTHFLSLGPRQKKRKKKRFPESTPIRHAYRQAKPPFSALPNPRTLLTPYLHTSVSHTPDVTPHTPKMKISIRNGKKKKIKNLVLRCHAMPCRAR